MTLIEEIPFWVGSDTYSTIKGILMFYPNAVLSHWWYLIILIVVTSIVGAIFAAAIHCDYEHSIFYPLTDKKFWKRFLPFVFCVYFLICILFSYKEYSTWRMFQWDEFVDECIENDNDALLDSAKQIHYKSYYELLERVKNK